MAIFMKYGNITGDATQAGYENWITLTHFSWKVDWQITTRAGVKSGTRDAKHPRVDPVTVNKQADAASAALLTAVCKSNNPETCVIRFVRTTHQHDQENQHYLEYIFSNALLTHLSSTAATGDDRPTEEIVINFTAVEMNVFTLQEDNVRAPPQRFTRFDVIEDKS